VVWWNAGFLFGVIVGFEVVEYWGCGGVLVGLLLESCGVVFIVGVCFFDVKIVVLCVFCFFVVGCGRSCVV